VPGIITVFDHAEETSGPDFSTKYAIRRSCFLSKT
jgi:hypothetical protein